VQYTWAEHYVTNYGGFILLAVARIGRGRSYATATTNHMKALVSMKDG
jgi:hypothetical protein